MMNEDKPQKSLTTIEDFLELTPVDKVHVPATLEQEENTAPVSHVQDDYEFARQQLRDIILNGSSLLQDASNLAAQGQAPEHFEVAASIINGLVSANKELMGLSATHQKITGANGPSNAKVNVQNGLFVGSMNDMLKIMKQAKNEQSDSGDDQ